MREVLSMCVVVGLRSEFRRANGLVQINTTKASVFVSIAHFINHYHIGLAHILPQLQDLQGVFTDVLFTLVRSFHRCRWSASAATCRFVRPTEHSLVS